MTNRHADTEYSKVSTFIANQGIEYVSVMGVDLHGYPRGKKLSASAFTANPQNPLTLSTLFTMLDCGNYPIEPPLDSKHWWPSWANGYPDSRACVDPQTFRRVPWQENTGLVICEFEPVNSQYSLDFLPRNVLRKLEAQCLKLGFEPRVGLEIETSLFHQPNSEESPHYQSLQPLWNGLEAYLVTTLGKHHRALDYCITNLTAFGLVLDSWHSEAGPGQLEISLMPNSAVECADAAFLLKHAMKELAANQNLIASFMAQIFSNGFANGTHANLSLWKDGRNAFHDLKSGTNISTVMSHAAAGLIETMAEFSILFAPTPNSHRRYRRYQWTGTQITWGVDNKSAALRAVTHDTQAARLEHRAPSADANPYLVLAACLAGMLYGIENQLEAPELITGDAYAEPSVRSLDDDYERAITRFANSALANHYFGADFVRFYAHSRAAEWSLFKSNVAATLGENVSEWEFQRYFELA